MSELIMNAGTFVPSWLEHMNMGGKEAETPVADL